PLPTPRRHSFPTRRSSDLPTPFTERMTFFWHGHFTSDFRKVNLQTPYIYWQNLTWRRMSLGNLHDMLYQVTKVAERHPSPRQVLDRKSTRLNSSHDQISYA